MTEQTQMPEQPKAQPSIFVGDLDRDDTPVMMRIWVRCRLRWGSREVDHTLPLEKIPLYRMLYRRFAGKCEVQSGLVDKRYAQYTHQKVSRLQLEQVIAELKGTFNNRNVGGVKVDFFDDLYGRGEACNLIEKMTRLAQHFNGDLDAEYIEGLIDQLFPTAKRSGSMADDRINIPGMDDLQMPEVGSAAAEPIDAIPEMPEMPELGADQAPPPPPSAHEPSMGLGALDDAQGDPELINFLQDFDQTDGKPFTLEQSIGIADLLAVKPVEMWGKDDLGPIPDLNMNSVGRISRVVESFYQSKQQAEAEAEGSTETGETVEAGAEATE